MKIEAIQTKLFMCSTLAMHTIDYSLAQKVSEAIYDVLQTGVTKIPGVIFQIRSGGGKTTLLSSLCSIIGSNNSIYIDIANIDLRKRYLKRLVPNVQCEFCLNYYAGALLKLHYCKHEELAKLC